MQQEMGFRPLIFGEVLFDHFPDGTAVLGGAPFNVAWNLQGLGQSPVFISAIGDDKQGQQIRERMTNWGMDLRGLQTIRNSATGKVEVTLADGQPTFEILPDRAFDQIAPPAFDITHHSFSMLYVGSLAYRSEFTRQTMQHLIQQGGLNRFVDINIRPPWFEESWLEPLLRGARWLKLSDGELQQLSGSTIETDEQIRAAGDTILQRFEIDQMMVTCGDRGACALNASGEFTFAAAPQPEPFVDAVGAGDAFAAATIAEIGVGRDVHQALTAAVKFAARTCSIQGATTDDQRHYQRSPSS